MHRMVPYRRKKYKHVTHKDERRFTFQRRQYYDNLRFKDCWHALQLEGYLKNLRKPVMTGVSSFIKIQFTNFYLPL